MTNVIAIQDIRKALNRKKAHLESIYELTVQQDTLINSLDVVGLMENLNARQEHIEAVETLEKGLPDRRTLLMNHDCARVAVAINAIVEKIQRLDIENQQKARDCLIFLKGQARKISESRTGALYETIPAGESQRCFDSKN